MRACSESSAARGMLSCNPAHAARRSDAAPSGIRWSRPPTRRRNARICRRVSRSRECIERSGEPRRRRPAEGERSVPRVNETRPRGSSGHAAGSQGREHPDDDWLGDISDDDWGPPQMESEGRRPVPPASQELPAAEGEPWLDDRAERPVPARPGAAGADRAVVGRRRLIAGLVLVAASRPVRHR